MVANGGPKGRGFQLGEPKPEFSVAVENYLQAIYKLTEVGEQVSPSRLAWVMSVTPATTVGMLKRLTKDKMIYIDNKGKTVLTQRGKRIGSSVVRRHRLAEKLLTDLLGIEWQHAHLEAHRLEHAISPQVEEKIAAILGYPKSNPFGYPVPGLGDPIQLPTIKSLDKMAEGEESVVERVPDHDVRILTFFQSNRLWPGSRIIVKETAPYKGTMTIDIEGDEMVLGFGIASWVHVRH